VREFYRTDILSFLKGFILHTVYRGCKGKGKGKGKGKVIPLQSRTGPEGSRRLRFPDFNTTGT